jgi:hypothetical protein
MAPVLSRRERTLTHRRLVRTAAGDDYTVRLFNSDVSSIISEKLFPEELAQFSNVIKDNRARLGSMREKITPTKGLPTKALRTTRSGRAGSNRPLQYAGSRRQSISQPSAKDWAISLPRPYAPRASGTTPKIGSSLFEGINNRRDRARPSVPKVVSP